MPLEHFQKMVFSGFFGVPKNSECHLYNKICITSLTFYSWSLLRKQTYKITRASFPIRFLRGEWLWNCFQLTLRW